VVVAGGGHLDADQLTREADLACDEGRRRAYERSVKKGNRLD